MTTKYPRQMISLDKTIYDWLKHSAKEQNTSISMFIRDQLHKVYELSEDKFWAEAGEKRLATINRKKLISHNKAWN